MLRHPIRSAVQVLVGSEKAPHDDLHPCALRRAPRLREGKGNRDASPRPKIKCRIQKDLGHQAGAGSGLAEVAKRALDAAKDAIPSRFQPGKLFAAYPISS